MAIKIRKPLHSRPKSKRGNFGKSRTKQGHLNETDINAIMRKARVTRQMPQAQHDSKAQFGDFSNVSSYQDAQNTIIQANQEFHKLPAELRRKFNNDPHELIEFLGNENNLDKAVELGLVVRNVEAGEEPVSATQPNNVQDNSNPEPSSE